MPLLSASDHAQIWLDLLHAVVVSLSQYTLNKCSDVPQNPRRVSCWSSHHVVIDATLEWHCQKWQVFDTHDEKQCTCWKNSYHGHFEVLDPTDDVECVQARFQQCELYCHLWQYAVLCWHNLPACCRSHDVIWLGLSQVIGRVSVFDDHFRSRDLTQLTPIPDLKCSSLL